MQQSLSYKKRALYLVVGLLVILILGYQFAFSKTIRLYQENKALEELTQRNESDLLMEISRASGKKKVLDSLITIREQNSSVSGMISSLFDQAERHNLIVSGIRDQKKTGRDDLLFHFEFSGLFVNMTKFLRSVEKELKSVNIASVEVVKNVDRRTAETRLFLKLTLRRPDYGE